MSKSLLILRAVPCPVSVQRLHSFWFSWSAFCYFPIEAIIAKIDLLYHVVYALRANILIIDSFCNKWHLWMVNNNASSFLFYYYCIISFLTGNIFVHSNECLIGCLVYLRTSFDFFSKFPWKNKRANVRLRRFIIGVQGVKILLRTTLKLDQKASVN